MGPTQSSPASELKKSLEHRSLPELASIAEEIPLLGGRLTAGVVRVENTVRRPWKSSSPFVSRLLTHLDEQAFAGAPRHLGSDRFGRDVFTYIPGWVPSKFQLFSDRQVRQAGALLRAFHDATLGSSLVGEKRVVCHNDAGPNNVVFQDGHPVAFIDFDMAAPGESVEDVGYMAWVWCVSSKLHQPIELQAAQVRTLVDAYGLDAGERARVFDAMLERQRRNIRFWIDKQSETEGGHVKQSNPEQIEEKVKWTRRELEYTVTNRAVFVAALS